MSVGNLVAVCFLSRDVAHREHLRTNSYAAHKVLQKFYEGIVPLADTLAETCQGRHITIKEIPYLAPEGKPDIVSQLEMHLKVIETSRFKDIDRNDTPIQNILDEIVGLYLRTLNMLRRFK